MDSGDRVAGWELWLTATAQHLERIVSPVARLGKDTDSELKLWFLFNVHHFHTIKLKNSKLGQCNSKILCIGVLGSQFERDHSCCSILRDYRGFGCQGLVLGSRFPGYLSLLSDPHPCSCWSCICVWPAQGRCWVGLFVPRTQCVLYPCTGACFPNRTMVG